MSQERLLRAGIISLGGAVTGAALNFLLIVLVGRGLGTTDTGTFFAVIGVFVVCANVLELGADTGLVRTVPRKLALGRGQDVRRVIWIGVVPVVAVGAPAVVALYLFADYVAAWLGGGPDQATRAEILRALAPFILCASLLAVLLGALRGLGGAFLFSAIQNVSLPAIRLVLVAFALASSLNVVAAARWWAATLPVLLAVTILLLVRAVRRGAYKSPGRPTNVMVLAGEFWSFSVPRGVAAGVEILLDWVDVFLVAALRTPAEAGIYAVATRCLRVGQMVEYAARIASSPQISAAAALGNAARLSSMYLSITRAMVLLAWPFYITLFAYAPTILSFFGSGFAEGALALRVLCLGMMLAIGAGALQTVLLMAGRSSWQLRNKATALGISVALNLVLIPQIGMVGAALAWVAATVADTALAVSQVRRLDVRLSVRQVASNGLVAILVFGLAAVIALFLSGQGVGQLISYLVVSGMMYMVIVHFVGRRLGVPDRVLIRSRSDA